MQNISIIIEDGRTFVAAPLEDPDGNRCTGCAAYGLNTGNLCIELATGDCMTDYIWGEKTNPTDIDEKIFGGVTYVRSPVPDSRHGNRCFGCAANVSGSHMCSALADSQCNSVYIWVKKPEAIVTLHRNVDGVAYKSTPIVNNYSCDECAGDASADVCRELMTDDCNKTYIWVKDDAPAPVVTKEEKITFYRTVDGVNYKSVPIINNYSCDECAGADLHDGCHNLSTKECGLEYVWAVTDEAPPAIEPTITKTITKTMKEEWADLMSAYIGAFDTPMHRRKMNDEYANDFRERMRNFAHYFDKE